MKKILIAYYSFSGTTRFLAETIADITKGELREIIPQKPYSFDYNTAVKEARQEIERGYAPKLVAGSEKVDGYDIIFLGMPNWFKTFPPPILSFLRNADIGEKIIAPFCTHGGGRIGQIPEDIAKECPKAKIAPPFATTADYTQDAVAKWVDGLNIVK